MSKGIGGTLIIESGTSGAEVFVDGERVGVVPLEPLALPLGEHSIKVMRAGFAPRIDVFSIQRKRPTRLNIALVPVAGVLKVSANIERARVFVDGKFIGEAPLTVEVIVGHATVQVARVGFRDFFQPISPVAGQETEVAAKLEELPVELIPSHRGVAPPRWYEKWWIWTTGAIGIAAVLTAVVVPVVLSQRDPVKDFGANYTFTVNPPGR